MLTVSIATPESKQGGVLKSAVYPSQWVVVSGNDSSSGDPALYAITTTGLASSATLQRIPFKANWVTNEDKIAYTDTVQVPTGTRVNTLFGRGIVVEDDYIYTQLGSGVYTTDGVAGSILTSGGALLYLNASGYPVCHSGVFSAASVERSSAVAELIAIRGTTVVYRTL